MGQGQTHFFTRYRLYRAGLVLRQAHERFKPQKDMSSQELSQGRRSAFTAREKYVNIFCKYRVVGWLGKKDVRTNLQFSPSGEIYDFGTIGVEKNDANIFSTCPHPIPKQTQLDLFKNWGLVRSAASGSRNPNFNRRMMMQVA
jgi:hypothetical protein